MSWRVVFQNVNDPWARYAIVCCNKTWGSPGCQPWTGDCVQVIWIPPGDSVSINCCSPDTKLITAVTSSDAGYYYRVFIYDPNGNLVKTCNYVDRNHPCVYSVGMPTPTPTPPTATPSPPPWSPPPTVRPPWSPTPTPTPTYPPPPTVSPPTVPEWVWYALVGAAAFAIGFGIAYAATRK